MIRADATRNSRQYAGTYDEWLFSTIMKRVLEKEKSGNRRFGVAG